MKNKLVRLLVLVLMLSMVLLGVSDSKASLGDTSAPDAGTSSTEIVGNEAQEENSPSATATITITWTTAPND